jgi:hypothetical protein
MAQKQSTEHEANWQELRKLTPGERMALRMAAKAEAKRQSTEHQRTQVGAISGRHPDTVKRYSGGLNVTASTRQHIEIACRELEYEHIIEERARALAAKEGKP